MHEKPNKLDEYYTICRRYREGPQEPQSHLLAEKPCRGNAFPIDTGLPKMLDEQAKELIAFPRTAHPGYNCFPLENFNCGSSP